MQFKKTAVAIALGLGLTTFAQATVYDLGTLYSGQTLSKDGVTVETTGVQYNHFDDVFTFKIEPGLQNAELGVFSIDLNFPSSGIQIEITSLWVNVYANGYTPGVSGDVGDVLHASGVRVVVDSFGKISYQFTDNIDFTAFPGVSEYALRITGETISSGLGAYDVSLSAGVVPEPAEYAMLLAGLGVVGMVARRRKMVVN